MLFSADAAMALIPVALSSLSRTSGYPEWFDVLPKTDQNIVAISQALKRNSQSIVGNTSLS